MKTLFSASRLEVPISFLLAIGPDFSIYNVVVVRLLVLRTKQACYLPSLPKPDFNRLHLSQYSLFTWGERSNIRVRCLAQGHNTWAHAGFMSPQSSTTELGVPCW